MYFAKFHSGEAQMATQGFQSRKTNMKRIIPNISVRWVFILMALISLGCTSRKDENAPLAPSTPASFSLTPTSAQVVKGGTQQFLQRGGVGGVTWAVSDTSLATINSSTAVLVASTTTGTVTVTATDSTGRKATSSVSIIDNRIILTPSTLTMSSSGPQTSTFIPVGAVGTVTYTLTGNTRNYKGASISSSGVLTIASWPTATNGSQTLTITASDGISTAGTATVSLPVTDTTLIVSPASLTLGLLTSSASTVVCGSVVCNVIYTTTPAATTGTVFYNLSGETNGYTGAKIVSSTGVLTVTASPTAAQGTQNLTITATEGTLTGTASLTLTVD